MLSRRDVVTGLAAAGTLVAAGCAALEPKLRAILADPMSTWVPGDVVAEERYESQARAGGIGGGVASASLVRSLVLPHPDRVDQAHRQAVAAAAAAGWSAEAESGLPDLGGFIKRLGKYYGTLRISRSPLSDSGLVIVITAG